MRTFNFMCLFLLISWAYKQANAQYRPYVKGALSVPAGKKLVFNPDLSDEFNNGTNFDRSKWETSSPNAGFRNWKGRFPGLFQDRAVSVKDGNLRIVASQKSTVYNGRTWTHEGGLVKSRKEGLYGYYECKMKANKTFMSSTFWLSSPCRGRITELDIQETVGANSGEKGWIEGFMRRINSNTHDWRNCKYDVDYNEKGGADLPGKASDDYHIYAAFWKSKDEIIFYLDGVEKYRIKPPSDFNLKLHMYMVVETYDFNPPKPGKDGMNLPTADRTTYYDYVRAWKLEDGDVTPPSNAIAVPGLLQAEDYTAHQGIQKENTSDAGGGQNIGYINNGDFTQYKINAQNAGTYKLNFRVASASAGGKITLKSNGNKVGEIDVTNTTGWQTWVSKSVNVDLPVGEQTLRLEFSGTPFYLFNINHVDFTLVTPSSVTKTLSPTQDAYLQGSTKIDDALIRIENGKRTGYLMYDLSGINGTVTSAKLVFNVAGDAGSGNLNVHKGSSNNWNENNLSNSNKPAAGTLLGSLNSSYPIGSTKTVDLNVSGISGSQLSLILTATSGNDFALAANEHASAASAQLVVTYTPNTNARTTQVQVAPETNIRAYPNPVQNRLFVKGATGVGFIYSIPSGRRIMKVNINSHNNSIDVSGLKTGQYTLTVNHTSFFNFIKK